MKFTSNWHLNEILHHFFSAHAHKDRPTCCRSRANCGTQERLEARCTEFTHRPHISTVPFHFEYESAIARRKSLGATREKTQATSPFVWNQNLLKCWYLCNTCLYHEFCCPTDSKAKTSDGSADPQRCSPLHCALVSQSLSLTDFSLLVLSLLLSLSLRTHCHFTILGFAVHLCCGAEMVWWRMIYTDISTSSSKPPRTPPHSLPQAQREV